MLHLKRRPSVYYLLLNLLLVVLLCPVQASSDTFTHCNTHTHRWHVHKKVRYVDKIVEEIKYVDRNVYKDNIIEVPVL
jgi:hypothetical protein